MKLSSNPPMPRGYSSPVGQKGYTQAPPRAVSSGIPGVGNGVSRGGFLKGVGRQHGRRAARGR